MTAHWSAPGRPLALDAGEVHVWRVLLEAPAALTRLGATLGDEERAHAAAFRRLGDRDRYVIAHGALRAILAGYLGTDPKVVRFVRSEAGKPRLLDAAASLRFNLSHSDALALCAVAADREVGVDVERVQPALVDEAAARVLPAADLEVLRAVAPARRVHAFFTLWTLHEAYVKARGDGLAVPADADEAWTRQPLPIDDGYAAAVAFERGARQVKCLEWSAPA